LKFDQNSPKWEKGVVNTYYSKYSQYKTWNNPCKCAPNLVQHNRVVEDFKLNLLVLNKIRFHLEIENHHHWKFSLFNFRQISKLKSVLRFGPKSINKNYLKNASKELVIFTAFVTLFLAIKLRASIPTPNMWASTTVTLIYKTYENIR